MTPTAKWSENARLRSTPTDLENESLHFAEWEEDR